VRRRVVMLRCRGGQAAAAQASPERLPCAVGAMLAVWWGASERVKGESLFLSSPTGRYKNQRPGYFSFSAAESLRRPFSFHPFSPLGRLYDEWWRIGPLNLQDCSRRSGYSRLREVPVRARPRGSGHAAGSDETEWRPSSGPEQAERLERRPWRAMAVAPTPPLQSTSVTAGQPAV